MKKKIKMTTLEQKHQNSTAMMENQNRDYINSVHIVRS